LASDLIPNVIKKSTAQTIVSLDDVSDVSGVLLHHSLFAMSSKIIFEDIAKKIVRYVECAYAQ